MKLSDGSKALLHAIRLTVEDQEFTAGELLHRCAGLHAREHADLAAAIPSRFNTQSLAWWLKKHLSSSHEGYRLGGEHRYRGARAGSSRGRGWVYYFDAVDDLGPDGVLLASAQEQQARLDRCRPGSIRSNKETGRLFEMIDKLDAEKRDREVPVPPARVTKTTVDSEGRLRTEVLTNRDGTPLKADVAPAPTPRVPPVIRRRGDKRPPWTLRGESIPRDRAEWLAHQEFRRTGLRAENGPGIWHDTDAPFGFLDPGGIVTHNQRFDSSNREVSTIWNGSLKDL